VDLKLRTVELELLKKTLEELITQVRDRVTEAETQ
jgi:hypothetical protein